MALTDTAIRNAKHRKTAYKLFDGEELFLLLHPNGSKYWRLNTVFEQGEDAGIGRLS